LVRTLYTVHRTRLPHISASVTLSLNLLPMYVLYVHCTLQNGRTPLLWAAASKRQGHLGICSLLLDHGADIEARDEVMYDDSCKATERRREADESKCK
jgi:ankyrin repeat protein